MLFCGAHVSDFRCLSWKDSRRGFHANLRHVKVRELHRKERALVNTTMATEYCLFRKQ